MKTFWKITLLVWALTVCIGGQDPKPSETGSMVQQTLVAKTTHSCEAKAVSQPRQKA
ncbi:hypothetical protein CLV31_102157 [Algoriphagus aquaeductus]|uniref:Uncharacterized protein n=1 Tax=Algoriphagus aquaeductus TaxID=475299 RepID=A0A326RXZ3_9BACT|nr:hypothetical protein [Algoriphagus aquaeductus]PZV86261.1 hypothetical protein CLV31_102157 [Algoriphagus aquaeductus]